METRLDNTLQPQYAILAERDANLNYRMDGYSSRMRATATTGYQSYTK